MLYEIILYALFVLGGLLLAVAYRLRKNSNGKSVAIFFMLFIYILSFGMTSIPDPSGVNWFMQEPRVYLYRSLMELVLVMLLHIKPCKEGVLISILCLLCVFINMAGFSFYVSNIDTGLAIDTAIPVAFYAQLMILFHTVMSDAIYRGINKLSFVRSHCSVRLNIRDKGL